MYYIFSLFSYVCVKHHTVLLTGFDTAIILVSENTICPVFKLLYKHILYMNSQGFHPDIPLEKVKYKLLSNLI